MFYSSFARKVAFSAIGGVFVSGFAIVSLYFAGALGGIEGDVPAEVVSTLVASLVATGAPAAGGVFACLLAYDLARAVAPRASALAQTFAHATYAALTSDAAWRIAGAMRSTAIVLLRVAWWVAAVVACILGFVFGIATAFILIENSTAMVLHVAEDPPALPSLALSLALPAILMYVGIGLLAGCALMAYAFVRPSRGHDTMRRRAS